MVPIYWLETAQIHVYSCYQTLVTLIFQVILVCWGTALSCILLVIKRIPHPLHNNFDFIQHSCKVLRLIQFFCVNPQIHGGTPEKYP